MWKYDQQLFERSASHLRQPDDSYAGIEPFDTLRDSKQGSSVGGCTDMMCCCASCLVQLHAEEEEEEFYIVRRELPPCVHHLLGTMGQPVK